MSHKRISLILSIFMFSFLSCVQEKTIGSKVFSTEQQGSLDGENLGGSDETTTGGLEGPALERFQAFTQVMSAKCFQCHNGGTASNFRNLNTEQNWADQGLVIPNFPENSPLFVSLKGAGIDITRESMPSAGLPLSTAQLNTVRDWIMNIDTSKFGTGVVECGTADAAGAPARTQRVVEIIRGSNCLNCHSVGGIPPALVGTTDLELYNAAAVTPRRLNASKLYVSLRGVMRGGPDMITRGSQNMPIGGQPFSAQEIADIREWVCRMPDIQ